MKTDVYEFMVLRTLFERKKWVPKVINLIKPDYFSNSKYREIFKRFLFLYTEKNEILSFEDVLVDSSLSNNIRNFLKNKEDRRRFLAKKNKDPLMKIPKRLSFFKKLIEQLKVRNQYKRLVLFQQDLTDKLNSIEEDNLTEKEITKVREFVYQNIENAFNLSESGKVLKLNKKIIKETLEDFKEKIENRFFVPTGFRAFDSVNIGIPKDSFFLISGKTGSGKSSLVLQMAINMKKLGARICIVPLEMSPEQLLFRIASNVLQLPVSNLVKDFEKHKRKILKALKETVISNNDDLSCIDIYQPEDNETIVDVLNYLKPFKYDVIFIDLINLLAPINKNDEQQSLNKAGRYAKVFATNNQTIVCFVAQLDTDKNRVRYARALTEHASNAWVWYETKDEINEQGFITIKQIKSRNQDPFDFKLKSDLKYFKFEDYNENENLEQNSNKNKPKRLSKQFDVVVEDEDIPSDSDI